MYYDLPEAADEAYALTFRGSGPGTFRICISRQHSQITQECTAGHIFEPAATKRAAASLEDWEQLKHALHTASFWAMPEYQCFHGLDGWSWEISGKDATRKHSSACWCPEHTNEVFYRLGLSFIKLTGVKNPAAAWKKFLSKQTGP